MARPVCKSCGRWALWYADNDDYFYREDIFFCEKCCLEQSECDCDDIRNVWVEKKESNED